MRVTRVWRACLDKRYLADFADVAHSAREGRQDVDRSRGEERGGGGNEDRGGVTVVSDRVGHSVVSDRVGHSGE